MLIDSILVLVDTWSWQYRGGWLRDFDSHTVFAFIYEVTNANFHGRMHQSICALLLHNKVEVSPVTPEEAEQLSSERIMGVCP